jgi:hypothetical protein
MMSLWIAAAGSPVAVDLPTSEGTESDKDEERIEETISEEAAFQRTLTVFFKPKDFKNKSEREKRVEKLKKVQKDLQILFDPVQSEGHFSFKKMLTLIGKLGGCIEYPKSGSSHFKIIFPGTVSGGFRPHGADHASELRGNALELFRDAIRDAGVNPQEYPELF